LSAIHVLDWLRWHPTAKKDGLRGILRQSSSRLFAAHVPSKEAHVFYLTELPKGFAKTCFQ
jgi:hypothetical protein